MKVLTTPRLLLRSWRAEDREPFARMNSDPNVMRLMPGLLTREESDAMIARMEDHFAEHGFGRYAVEIRATGEFAGFVGLSIPPFDAPFQPCVEVGWRIAAEHWNRGYATEAARAVCEDAANIPKLPQIVSFTVPQNTASRRVMEKLGMVHDPSNDFDHPKLAEGHPLRRHVLYRL